MGIRAILASGVDKFFCMLRGRIREELGTPEKVPHNRPKRIGVHLREIPMHHDDQVDPLRHLVSVKANVLAKSPLDPIPGHGTPEASRNGQAEPSSRAGLTLDKETQASRGHFLAAPDHCPEFPRRANAIHPRYTLSHLPPQPPFCHTVSRLRPFARRRLKIRRPAFVRMRRRNPWVRFRFTRLG
jgi:hypothetical protein